jgi:HD-GYP domain-containing protein (c-di-GMP phosphodiesterase class II)
MRSTDTARELAVLTSQLEELNRIGAALSAERDMGRLLDMILTKARAITSADAGSLYVVEKIEDAEDRSTERRRLRFKYAQNDSVSWPFRESVLDLDDRSIAGRVALRGEAVNLPNVYDLPPGSPFAFNRGFDEAAGYRTRSMLAVPMRTPKGDVIGVLQLINAKRRASATLTGPGDVDAQVIPFTDRQTALVTSLASQAAVALENSQLYLAIQRLFEGFVRASVVAIEARDPTTSGHSFRVANLTVALAEAVDRADSGTFADVRFSREDMRTIRYASLLHDFGKVGVREEVLVKAKKLYPDQLGLVRERFKLARRSREAASLEARLHFLLAHGRDEYVRRLPQFDVELADQVAELERHLAAVEAANEPSVLPEGSFDRLRDIAAVEYHDPDGARRQLLLDDEVRLLSLRKGSLSEAERTQIESHVLHTFRFLSQIPWTREIRAIPAIAVGHHEKLNGQGYPYKLSAPDIPIQTRMMTISDIFDALSAADRPYKKAVPIERALEILGCAVQDGELDPSLFRVFVEARVFDRWKVEPHPY